MYNVLSCFLLLHEGITLTETEEYCFRHVILVDGKAWIKIAVKIKTAENLVKQLVACLS